MTPRPSWWQVQPLLSIFFPSFSRFDHHTWRKFETPNSLKQWKRNTLTIGWSVSTLSIHRRERANRCWRVPKGLLRKKNETPSRQNCKSGGMSLEREKNQETEGMCIEPWRAAVAIHLMESGLNQFQTETDPSQRLMPSLVLSFKGDGKCLSGWSFAGLNFSISLILPNEWHCNLH